jgi:hypothetical protein
MTIKAQISEADITRISPGQKAYFTIFSDPDKRYDATLRTIELAPESVMKDDSLAGTSSASGSGTSNASVYYNALLDVPNPENRLRIAITRLPREWRCGASDRITVSGWKSILLLR